MKRVDLPVYEKVPRWLVLQGEIDLRVFIVEKMLADDKKKPPLHKMIDEATGYDKQLEKEALELIEELRWLKSEYDKETAPQTKKVS